MAGVTVVALDRRVLGHPGDAGAQRRPETKTAAATAVLADEWSAEIQSEASWRTKRGSWNAGNGPQGRPSQLQGPPQQPSWFMAPAPANPWMELPRYADRDSINPFGQGSFPRGVSGYRTVCVRSCDGFFFPISFGASELNFSRDQATCTNSCPGAKLYYYRAGIEQPQDMVDLSGQKYSRSKNADLFRTQYVESCTCKPHPWEQEATDRHRIFALEDQRRKGNRAVIAELEALKSRNRADNRSGSRRRLGDLRLDPEVGTAAARASRHAAAPQPAAPRSDVSRGQGGERHDQLASLPAPAIAATAGRAPSVVTEAVAKAASAATVQ